jgi:hypothetical protein
MDQTSSKPHTASAFPKLMLALFFAIFPFGVGLALLVFLWSGGHDEFGAPPLFFRVMGSLIALAFVGFGATLIYGTLAMRGPASFAARAASLASQAAKGASAHSLARDCPRCGAPLADAADVSESGDTKCQHCGSWFNVRGK